MAIAGGVCGLAILLGVERRRRRRAFSTNRDHGPQQRRKLDGIIVLVGMRGAGKSALGKAAAALLGRKCLDLDEVLEHNVLGKRIPEFVDAHGWHAFRQAEAQLLEAVLIRGEHGVKVPEGCIVACGGGVIETPSAWALLESVTPVVFIDRHIEDILTYLQGAGSYRPGLGTPPAEIYARRLPLYRGCSSHVFTLSRGDAHWEVLSAEFANFLRHAEGAPNERELQLVPDTFLLSINSHEVSDLLHEPARLHTVIRGADVLQLCVEVPLPEAALPDEERWLLEMLAVLRRHCLAPLCLAVEAKTEVDRITGSGREGACSTTVDVARIAIKAGCAAVMIDAACLSVAQADKLAAIKGITKLVAVHRPRHQRIKSLSLHCTADAGSYDLVRFEIPGCADAVDATMEDYHGARHAVSTTQHSIPVSVIQSGAAGKLSCLLDPILTPITHPSLPGRDEVKLLTAQEAVECRSKLGILDACKRFYVFGHPVTLSASPTILNAGFRANGCPFVYGRYDSPSIEDVLWKLSLASTGGGSVTIPHKEVLLEHMDQLSDAARAIGAVNTVTKEFGTGKLLGDNTDWLGIRGQVLPKLVEKTREGRVGVILGAGGTAKAAAFAFREMGFVEVLILNRTLEKAASLAADFGTGFRVAGSTTELEDLTRLDAVMATLPGSAGATLPDSVLEKHKPVVVDAAYQSSASGVRHTALLQQAIAKGCPVVEGLEMLFEQGCAQCEIWTGRPPPRSEIARALLDDRFSGDPSPPPGLVAEASS